MKEVVFFDYEGVCAFLKSSSQDIKVVSLIEKESNEIRANLSLNFVKLDSIEVEIGGFWVPLSSTFIFYPWQNAILITHGKEIFNLIKCARNNYKINAIEQAQLLSSSVGIVGLSVGCSIAKTLVMEGLCGRIKISDFDTLDISNTNRIDWGVFDIGMAKAELLYRWIKESNPFIEVEVFNEGINESNVDTFCQSENGSIDLLIDECDSLRTKILLRQIAKGRSIPLVMHTSDRGMLDIENYKIENDYESFLSQFSDYSEEQLRLESGRIISSFCDLNLASERSVFSFMEIGRSISSWPQLAEDVISGAGNTACVVRRLLLGESLRSQRAYINCDNLKTL